MPPGPQYFLAGGGESCSTACAHKDDSFPETVSIAGETAYNSMRGRYTKAAGLEHAGAPVYKRDSWSLYKRSNGKWYLDFNEVDDSWAGTVNYALHASDTPFTATWNRDLVVNNEDSACDLGAITSAASSVARCVNVVSALGMSFTKSGMYPGDVSGCTYYFDQTGWVQVMNSGLDSGATPAPTCDEINSDQSRRRVCACSMKA